MNSTKQAYLFLAGDCPQPYPGDLPCEQGFIVAVDGGYQHLSRLGLEPGLLLGDFDSLDPTLIPEIETAGVEVQRFPQIKDNSDTDLACEELYRRGYRLCYLFGALGGARFDHSLGNIGLLYLWKCRGLRLVILQSNLRIEVISAETLILPCHKDDLISLLPLTPRVERVTTRGLHYPLQAETIYYGVSRSLSNVATTEEFQVTAGEGTLLVMHYRH